MRKLLLIIAIVASMGPALTGCAAHINESGAGARIL
jgi:hypothetical protein